MQYLLKGMKIRCWLFYWVHINFSPCLHSSTGNRSIFKKKGLFVLPAHFANAFFCARHYLKDFSLRKSDSVEENRASVSFPSLLLSKHAVMPKPLGNLEGIFILPQGQHMFFPGSPIAQTVQSAKNQRSPERMDWFNRQPLWLMKKIAEFTGHQNCPKSTT